MGYSIGPVDVSDKLGKEVMVRFETDIVSDDGWATDANGGKMVCVKTCV